MNPSDRRPIALLCQTPALFAGKNCLFSGIPISMLVKLRRVAVRLDRKAVCPPCWQVVSPNFYKMQGGSTAYNEFTRSVANCVNRNRKHTSRKNDVDEIAKSSILVELPCCLGDLRCVFTRTRGEVQSRHPARAFGPLLRLSRARRETP